MPRRITTQFILVLFMFVSLLPVASAKIVNPSDLEGMLWNDIKDHPGGKSYYNTIRKIVLLKVYQAYNRPEEGMVAIAFDVGQKGMISNLRILNEKTDASASLKDLVLNSVSSIQKFPPIPKRLSQHTILDFVLVVTFKIKEERSPFGRQR